MTTAERTCPKCGTALSDDALEGLCRKCLSGLGFGFFAGESETGAPAGLPGLHRLGDYELIEEIARGGMGVVYKARQLKLNRIVAVKVVLHGPFSSPEFVQRFRAEAETAAGLQHPNIVAIYEVGEHDGHHYFSMEYIEGKDLAELVREQPLPARRAADYLKTIAEAVHYAHQRGVLHRDLKPSNLLLDVFDQPRITDFGLAELLTRDAELTTTGQVLGSPSHIPPEQASGKFAPAAPTGDIYSLGAMLYHLLTGRPPFQGETVQEILLQVQNVEPVSPRRLNPSVPADLQTICLKCLQKEPARRYQSAQELADDLGHFLANEPIHARPVAPVEKAWLWCRRRPALALLSGGIVLAVMLGLLGVLWQWRRAEQHAATLRLNLYAADVSLASQAIQRGDFGLARRTLAELQPEPSGVDLRGFEWRYLWNLCRGDELATLTGHEWIVTCVTFSPDGKLIATGSQDGTVRIWDAEHREHITTLAGVARAVWSVAFSPDGRLLLTAGHEEVRLWNTETWQWVTNLPGRMAAMSAIEPVIAMAESSPFFWEPAGKVTLWNYQRGEKLHELSKPGRRMAFSPDGQTLAVATASTGVDLWEVASARWLRTLSTSNAVWSLAFSPAGNQLAVAGWSSEATIFDLAGDQPSGKLKGHFLTVWSAVFSPDGATLATTGSDQTVRLWDAATLESKGVLRGHDNEVWCAAFSPDGKLLATGGKDQNLKLWSTETRTRRDRLPSRTITRPIVSPDGTKIATRWPAESWSHSTLWDIERCSPVWEVPQGREAIGFSADGSRMITWDENQLGLVFWSPTDGDSNHVAVADPGSVIGAFWPWGFSPERNVLFAVERTTGLIRFWETASGKTLGSVQGPLPPIRRACLGTEGRHLAISVERENVVRLYETANRREIQLTGHRDFVSGLAFSPDGATLASGSMDGTIRLWDVLTGMQTALLPGHMEETTDVAFSPDGQTLASVNRKNSVKLWHLPTQRELLSLPFPEAGHFLQFSPDGRYLVVSTEEDSIRLLNAPPLEELDERR